MARGKEKHSKWEIEKIERNIDKSIEKNINTAR